MQPNTKHITISTNPALVETFISEVLLLPRLKVIEWSQITKQTPGLKIGYPAQHIASLLTGVEGSRTAARGDDLADGSEVKGCNRLDQLDTCNDCKNKVLRSESSCSFCKSNNIARKDDSKWLLTIKSLNELKLYTEKIDRLIFILLDYPNFEQGDFETLSIKAYEIWPKFNPDFQQIVNDYYYKIYLEHIKSDPKKTPAPKNFWPYSFQFYKCKPRKTYECQVTSINTKPIINTITFTKPTTDRSLIKPEDVPTKILSSQEIEIVLKHHRKHLQKTNFRAVEYWDSLSTQQQSTKSAKEILYQLLPSLECSLIDCIDLRDTSKATPHTTLYNRR